MPTTGIFRQILFKQGNDDDNSRIPPVFITIAVLVVSAVFAVLLKLPFIQKLSGNKGYFFNLDTYFWFILSFFLANLLFLFLPGSRKFNPPFNLVLVLADGYALSEILYRVHPLLVSRKILTFLGGNEAAHLNGFFLHRFYQVIPLIMGIALFFAYGTKYFENYLKFGDLSIETHIINKAQAQPWRNILLKFGLWIAGLTVFICAVQHNKMGGKFPYLMLAPILLYALWNCLVEEVIFRGLLLSMSSKILKIEWANILQALLFGLIHYAPQDVKGSLIKVVLFAYLGWFFGKATMETKGIGISFIIHTLLVAGIEIRLLMQ